MITYLIFYFFAFKPQIYAFSSLIIPGSGELFLQEKKGEYLIYTDLLFLSFYHGFNFFANKENENAKLFASQYAKANFFQDDKYFKLLEIYLTSEDYNLEVMKEARELYPDNPDKQKEYLIKNGYFGNNSWQWENDSLRLDYFQKRRNARNKKLISSFFISSSILLRIGSFFNCLFYAKHKNLSFEFYPNEFKITYKF